MSVRFRAGAWPAVSSFQQTSYEESLASGAVLRPGGDAVTSRYWQAKSSCPKVRRSPFEMASAYRRAASVAGLWTVARAFGVCDGAAAVACIAELASQIVNSPPTSNAAVSGLHRVMISACIERSRTPDPLVNLTRRPTGLTELDHRDRAAFKIFSRIRARLRADRAGVGFRRQSDTVWRREATNSSQ